MERKRIMAVMAIFGLVLSGYAFAQTNKVLKETISAVGAAGIGSATTASMPNPRQVMCKKTVSGSCMSIECDDGFLLKQCQDACKTYTDEQGCKVTVCNGVESRECPGVSERVTCTFTNTKEPQKCYSEKGGCTAYPTKCEDGKVCPITDYISCTAKVSGKKGETLNWKSSCGGYATTTVDGIDEAVKFQCQQVCKEYMDGNGCWVRECPGQPTVTACPVTDKAN